MFEDLPRIRQFAGALHARGEVWSGYAFGRPTEYNPERREPPLDSKMTFTPADFCIGESGIWFFSLMWEHGKDAEPVEFLDDRNVVRVLAKQEHSVRLPSLLTSGVVEMNSTTRITFDPRVMGGKPCIRGMRVTVGMIVGLVAAGYSTDEILAAYPYLEAADIREALSCSF